MENKFVNRKLEKRGWSVRATSACGPDYYKVVLDVYTILHWKINLE
jgi:hypothetical protein